MTINKCSWIKSVPFVVDDDDDRWWWNYNYLYSVVTTVWQIMLVQEVLYFTKYIIYFTAFFQEELQFKFIGQ